MSDSRNNLSGRLPSLPVWTLLTAVALVALAILAIAFVDLDKTTTPLLFSVIGLVLSTVPSLIAAAFSERASTDIRNGTITGKVKNALEETGVVDVVNTSKESMPKTLGALTASNEALSLLIQRSLAERENREGEGR